MDAPHPTPAVASPHGLHPFDPVDDLGHGSGYVLLFALVLALGVHGFAGARVLWSFPYLVELSKSVRHSLQERLHSQVDIEVDKPPPPPPPPPVPDKEPEPPPPAAHAAPPPPEAAAKPPAAAEAGKVLTSDPDPDEPVDLTGDGFVSGNGDRFAGGITATQGTGKTAVRNLAAAPTGTGTGVRPPAPPPAPSVNLSRSAGPAPGSWADCGFPPEADAEGINFKLVKISVTVKADGHARSVSILADPGFGFASWARQCAMRKTYTPALNASGDAIEQTTPPFNVRFER